MLPLLLARRSQRKTGSTFPSATLSREAVRRSAEVQRADLRSRRRQARRQLLEGGSQVMLPGRKAGPRERLVPVDRTRETIVRHSLPGSKRKILVTREQHDPE